MKNILILGAGQSAPLLIRDLLHHAGEHDWRVTVADLNRDAAEARLEGNPHGRAIAFDAEAGNEEIAAADLVVNLLPPSFQAPIAEQCVEAGRPMISASYTAAATRELDAAARERGVLILTEMGLDPGIDHMSTMELLDRLAREGAAVESFESYGSGVPAPDSVDNPFGYAITWNPRNVVVAARDGAQFLRGGRVQVAPWTRIFEESWRVEVDGVGPMDAYPNRDSLAYREIFRLHDAHTLIRGTLRHAGYCALWRHVVRMGLANDALVIPGLAELSFRDLTDMFLPDGLPGRSVEERAAAYLQLDPQGGEMTGLSWLGLFSADEPVAVDGTAVDALVALLYRKFKLPEGGRDMVILQHQLGIRRADGRREKITSWMVEHGEPGGITAMARTVGLPAAIAARLVLTGQLTETGVHIPTTPAFYEPVLAELDKAGIQFTERSEAT